MEVNFLRSNPVHFSLGPSEQLKSPQRDFLRPIRQIRGSNQLANLGPMTAMRMSVLRRMRMFLPMRVFMLAAMMMPVITMFMVPVVVVVVLVAPGLFGQRAVFEHVHLGRPNPTAIHRVNPQFRPDFQGSRRFLQKFRRHASVNQRTQQHVSGNSREALNLADFHIVVCREPAFS
jgi:hypothetical protein